MFTSSLTRSLCGVALISSALSVHAAVIDFNGPGYSTGPINTASGGAWTVAGGANYTVAAGGLSGGSGTAQELIPDASGGDTSAYFATGYDLAAGSVTVGAFFRYGSVASSGGTPFTLGFSGDTSSLLNSGGATDVFIFRINKPAANEGRLTLQTRTNSLAATGGLASFAFTDGAWYYGETTLTRLGTGNDFSMSAALYNATGAGVVGSLVDSIGATALSSATLHADSTIFTGLRGFHQQGLRGVDNFTITAIPEPSSAAVLLGLGALGCAAQRRRRNR